MIPNQTYNGKELLLRVAAGDERAFSELIHTYSPKLHGFLVKHMESHELAEEIVQDIFVQVWQTRETLSEVRNFNTYLFVLCRNRAFNELKKLSRQKRRMQEWKAAFEAGSAPEETIDTEAGLNLVEEAIEQLSPKQKKVWIMSRREGLSYIQIAERMQISRETVKSYLQVANASLIKYLAGRMELWVLIILWKEY